ncbi:MAG: hypothetical protein V4624_09910 [Pseudomonadota bacterium]
MKRDQPQPLVSYLRVLGLSAPVGISKSCPHADAFKLASSRPDVNARSSLKAACLIAAMVDPNLAASLRQGIVDQRLPSRALMIRR